MSKDPAPALAEVEPAVEVSKDSAAASPEIEPQQATCIPPTPSSISDQSNPPLPHETIERRSFLQDLFDIPPERNGIEEKLDTIIANQQALLSLMSKLLAESRRREFQAQGVGRTPNWDEGGKRTTFFTEGSFSAEGREGSFSEGRDGNFSEGGEGSFSEGRDANFSEGVEESFSEGRYGNFSEEVEGSFSEGSLSEGREGGDISITEVMKIKSGSCSVGNFAVKLMQAIFLPRELSDRNCTGKRGKRALDPNKLEVVKDYVFKMYPTQQKPEQWRKCVIAIDEFLRRKKKDVLRQD